MDRVLYISPIDLSGINSISKLANYETFLEHLDPINYHFLLFSTLYQSGTSFFQLDKSILPETILANPFWKDKFIDIDNKAYDKSIEKATNILKENFDFELDRKYRAPQYENLKSFFSSLFYSVETGVPFVNAEFSESKNFDFLESRLRRELFIAIKNFNELIHSDNVSTIVPQYTVLKKDVRRFEDIANSTLYLKYSESLHLLSDTKKIETIKKDIHANALKVYNKYANHLDLKAMAFGFLKFNKKIVDLFTNKVTSIFGDFIIEAIEKSSTGKKKIHYYKVDEAHYMIQWANRIGELMSKGGKDKLDLFLKEYKTKNSR
jgi:hypothetical protein